jgi:hypothetical protein
MQPRIRFIGRGQTLRRSLLQLLGVVIASSAMAASVVSYAAGSETTSSPSSEASTRPFPWGAGTSLVQPMTEAVPGEGGRVEVDSVEMFDQAGGWVLVAQGSGAAEAMSYEGVDETTRELVGVVRRNPGNHDAGVFVEYVQGSQIAEPMTKSSHSNGRDLVVRSLDTMNPDGGTVVVEAGTAREERMSYRGIDRGRSALVGITRRQPRSHDDGAFIESEPAGIMEATTADAGETHDEDEATLDPAAVPEPMLGSQTTFISYFGGSDTKKGLRDAAGACIKPSGSDGVGDWFNDDCSPHSAWDFGGSGWIHGFPGDSTQRNRIYESGTVSGGRGGGDAGFHKLFQVAAGQEYVLAAKVKLNNVSRAHQLACRGRLTIHQYDAAGRILKYLNSREVWVPYECNAFLFEAGTALQSVATTPCTMETNAVKLKINGRAHSKSYRWFRDHDDPAISGAVTKPSTKEWQDVAGWGQAVFGEISLQRVS